MFIVSSITEYNTARTITYNKALANIQQVLSSTMKSLILRHVAASKA